jgi:periplasmic copper chaperone A
MMHLKKDRHMTTAFRFFAMLAAFAGLTQAVSAADIVITSAVARASLTPTTTTGAIYVSMQNTGATDDRLLTLSTPAATSTMIHETTLDKDVMKMRMVEGGLPIPAGATLDMKSGGTHVMLMGLKAPLKTGETIALELVFEKAGKLRVDIPVKGVAD